MADINVLNIDPKRKVGDEDLSPEELAVKYFHPNVVQALNEIDAALFSGGLSPDDIWIYSLFIDRWKRALNERSEEFQVPNE